MVDFPGEVDTHRVRRSKIQWTSNILQKLPLQHFLGHCPRQRDPQGFRGDRRRTTRAPRPPSRFGASTCSATRPCRSRIASTLRAKTAVPLPCTTNRSRRSSLFALSRKRRRASRASWRVFPCRSIVAATVKSRRRMCLSSLGPPRSPASLRPPRRAPGGSPPSNFCLRAADLEAPRDSTPARKTRARSTPRVHLNLLRSRAPAWPARDHLRAREP